MSMPALATVPELADWLGEPILEGDRDFARAQAMLSYSSSLVRQETGSDWLDDQGLVSAGLPDVARQVTLACAARAYTNPTATTGERIDDYQAYVRVEEAGIYLTATERAMLSRATSGRKLGLSVVHTTRDPDVKPEAIPSWVINGPSSRPQEEP